MASYLPTEQLPQKAPPQDYHRNTQKKRQLRKKLILLEITFGNIVLLIATISSFLCLWSFSGKSISEFPYAPAALVALGIQVLPWIIKSATPCTHLTSISAICILMALLSFVSGVGLIKKNPKKQSHSRPEVSQILPKVTILPVVEKPSSSDEGTVALYQQ